MKMLFQNDCNERCSLSSFIILATPRSGSTFVAEKFGITGLCGNLREWLQSDLLEKVRIDHCLDRSVELPLLIKTLVKSEADENKRFGLKLMWETWGDYHIKELHTFPQYHDASSVQIFLDLFPSPLFVIVERNNKVKQAISYLKAQQSNLWEMKNDIMPFPEDLLVFDYHQILTTVKWMELHSQKWRDFSLATKRPVAIINYEDFVPNYQEDVSLTLKMFGFNEDIQVSKTEKIVQRMSDNINSSWCRQFNEIHSCAHEDTSGPFLLKAGDGRYDIEICEGELCSALSEGGIVHKAPASLRGKRLHVITDARFCMTVTITNRSPMTWKRYGHPEDETGWIMLAAHWLTQDGKSYSISQVSGDVSEKNNQCFDEDRFVCYLPSDLAPNQRIPLKLVCKAPDKSGTYQLKLVMRCGYIDFAEFGGKPVYIETKVTLPKSRLAAMNYFKEAGCLVSGGWRVSSWFGLYLDFDFPWIYHSEHGWLCCSGEGGTTDSFWFLDSHLGWIYTSSSKYPKLYVKEKSEWLVYRKGTTKPRRFENMNTGKEISL